MLKPTVRTLKNITGRKIIGYAATLGNIEVHDDDKATAIAKCVAAALQALNNDGAVTVIHDLHPDANGIRACWILEFRNGGWGYRIARPMRPGSHYDGHSGCVLGEQYNTRRDAEIKMQEHWYSVNVQPFADLLRAIGALAVEPAAPSLKVATKRAPGITTMVLGF